MGAGRIRLAGGCIGAMLAWPLAAADAPTCAALETLLLRVEERLVDWSDSDRANRIGLARLAISATPALAHGQDAGLAPEVLAAITAIRDLGRTEAGQPVPPLAALRLRLRDEGMSLAAAVPGICMGQAVPDLAGLVP